MAEGGFAGKGMALVILQDAPLQVEERLAGPGLATTCWNTVCLWPGRTLSPEQLATIHDKPDLNISLLSLFPLSLTPSSLSPPSLSPMLPLILQYPSRRMSHLQRTVAHGH